MARRVEWWDPRPPAEHVSAEGLFDPAPAEPRPTDGLERRLRSLVERLPAIVYIESDEAPSPTTFVSHRIEEVLGYPHASFVNDRSFWTGLLHPEDIEAAERADRRAGQTREPYVAEYRLRASDGTYRWFHDEAVFTEDQDGGPSYWQGVMFDITERKQAELQIQELEAKYRNLVEQLPAVTYIDSLDEQHTSLYVSPQADRLLGIPRDVFRTMDRWESALHPDDRDEAVRATRDFERSDGYSLEYRMLRSDGGVVWIHDQASIVRDDDGRPLYLQGLYLDITDEKRREEEQRETDALYRNLVEHIPGVVYREGVAGSIGSPSYMSPRYFDLFGYTSQERIANPELWTELLHPDDREAMVAAAERATEEGRFSEDYRMIARDGRVVWVHDETIPVLDEDGNILSWQGFLFDITDRKVAEQALRDAEERYRTLVERLPVVSYAIDVEYSPESRYVAPAIERLTGYTPQEWLADQQIWSKMLHPDDRDVAIAEWERTVEHGGSFAMDYRIVRKDGEIVWVRDEASVVDWQGRPHIEGMFLDITDRKRAEQEIAETAAQFKTLAERIPAVTYIERLGGPVNPLYISPQYEAFFGYTAEERMSQPDLWKRLLHPDDRERIFAAAETISPETGSWSLEYRMIHRDGHVVWVRDEGTLVCDEDGEPLFWQGVLLDISENKRIEEELQLALEKRRQADEMKNTFLTAVSHDLRTPLSAILGSAITLQQGDELGITEQERHDLLEALTSKTRRLTALVTDLLDMDRLTRGVVEPRLAPVEVGDLVSRLVSESDLPSAHTLRVEVRPAVVVVDRSMVERIVENLIANTAKHTPPGTNVWVRVSQHPDGILLSVEDDGPGVPVELRESLFRPFERGPSASSHSPGVGLGLSLVSRFAELHGGRAWVEEREGGGAAFRVFLPGR